MPKSPRTPCTRIKRARQPSAVTSPYFGSDSTTSPCFGRISCEASPVNAYDASSDELDEFGVPPYNSYWGALARAARAKPNLIQGDPSVGLISYIYH